MSVDFFNCSNCGKDVSGFIGRNCPTCGYNLGPPNVRDVGRPKETQALKERYEEAKKSSGERGVQDSVEAFENRMSETKAVLNMSLGGLYNFINEGSLYSTYRLQVEGESRRPADRQNDRARTAIEGMFFGSYAKKIRYAALSLDKNGLPSYGKYTIIFRDVAIKRRATLLEENTYHFAETHDMNPPDSSIPSGYRSVWEDRNELAVAKLACRITEETTAEDHASLLLFSEGDRETDEFIEVHIYGAFDIGAVEAVKGSSTVASSQETVKIKTVKERLDKAGKEWIES